MENTTVNRLAEMIKSSERIAFLGGAGVSTESGIPDFRSENGVFAATEKYGVPPETLLSIDFFRRDPETFYRYYREALLIPNARPNNAHIVLAKLEAAHKLTAVITQNIDDLHQRAGSRNVLELHGTTYKHYCMRCHKRYGIDDINKTDNVPYCSCGGIIRPDVVLYGESLKDVVINAAIRHISQADMLIVGGTSLVVYPAAGLVNYYSGDRLVLINKSQTSYDGYANLIIHEPIGETLKNVADILRL